MKYKKGISAVVTVMLLIILVLAGTTIIWRVLTKTVNEGLEKSKTCYDLLGKLSIRNEYTCYDPINEEMFISIEQGDIDVDGLLIIISNEDSAQSFELTNELSNVQGLLNYTRGEQVKVPEKNSGSTYIATGIKDTPLSIELAPKLNDKLCESETFTTITLCS